MNISKFTQKSLQAVQDLEKTAYAYGNQEVEQEHLLHNLLVQEFPGTGDSPGPVQGFRS